MTAMAQLSCIHVSYALFRLSELYMRLPNSLLWFTALLNDQYAALYVVAPDCLWRRCGRFLANRMPSISYPRYHVHS